MIVLVKSSEDLPLGKKQICILCESNENIPESFTIDNITYRVKMAAVIPYEYTQKGILKGSILESITYIISGCDEAGSFEKIYLSNEEEVKKTCKDIWKNPDKYSDYQKNSDGAWNHFLKYLYVTFPDGSEKRLHAVAES